MKKPLFILTIIILSSCKTAEIVTSDSQNTTFTSHTFQHDTVVVRDSIYIYERTMGDTVYLTRTEWRERWCTKIERDTIRNTEYITQTIESPPVKYIPRFYKGCTIAFWVIIGLVIGFLALKRWL